jgi:hypothetical protein
LGCEIVRHRKIAPKSGRGALTHRRLPDTVIIPGFESGHRPVAEGTKVERAYEKLGERRSAAQDAIARKNAIARQRVVARKTVPDLASTVSR